MNGLLTDAGVRTWANAVMLAPDAFAAVEDTQRTMWDRVDPLLLELARVRIAQLLGADAAAALRSARASDAGLEEATLADVRAWPTSPRFGERERACLALTEQYLIDVNGVTDEQVATVIDHIGAPQTHAFVSALWAFEQVLRICLVLNIDTPPHHLGAVS